MREKKNWTAAADCTKLITPHYINPFGITGYVIHEISLKQLTRIKKFE